SPARRKVAESKDARTQPGSEEEVQDAHHVTLDGTAEDGQEESACWFWSRLQLRLECGVLGVSGPDVPEQASVGGAVKVESPVVDGTSERSQLDHDMIEIDALDEKTTPGETPTIKLECPLSTVKEEATSDTLGGSIPDADTKLRVDMTAVDDAGAPANAVVPNLVKLYVDDQVRRWEQVSLEYVRSPMIEYAWPHHAPNFQAWYETVMATSEYLTSRMSSGARAQTWISEWRLVRLAPNMATDLTSVTVPLNELSMRECAAVLQTMFLFKFRNLDPEWFRVSTPKAEIDTMRRVAEGLQRLLTVELLEWQQVISGHMQFAHALPAGMVFAAQGVSLNLKVVWVFK
ncbi:hypothetical protein PHMEG_00035471, partial [Phytophthora megakarya]